MSDEGNPWLERRRDVRYAIDLRVRVRATGKEQFTTLEAKDISRGGMFLAMDDPMPKGTRVSIELTHGRGYSMLLPGEVVRSVDSSQVGAEGAGVGIRIGPLSDAEQEILDVFIEETSGPEDRPVPEPAPAHGPLERIKECHERARNESPGAFFGVAEDAPPTARRLAYQAMIREWHPSNFMNESRDVLEAATALCRSIRNAFERWSKSR